MENCNISLTLAGHGGGVFPLYTASYVVPKSNGARVPCPLILGAHSLALSLGSPI